MFTGVRGDLPEWGRLSTRVGRGVLRRFDRATKAFYKRCKEGHNPGFPRFKPRHRWRSIEIPDASASMVAPPDADHGSKWWRLRVKGLPRLRFQDKGDRLAEALGGGGRVVELRVVRTPLRTEVHAVVKHPDRPVPEREAVNPVGLDKGLKTRLVTSDGEHVPPTTVDLQKALRAQRRFSRSVKGSASRIKKRNHLAKQHRRLQEQAIQSDFRLADRLVKAYDGGRGDWRKGRAEATHGKARRYV